MTKTVSLNGSVSRPVMTYMAARAGTPVVAKTMARELNLKEGTVTSWLAAFVKQYPSFAQWVARGQYQWTEGMDVEAVAQAAISTPQEQPPTEVLLATVSSEQDSVKLMKVIEKDSGGKTIWRREDTGELGFWTPL